MILNINLVGSSNPLVQLGDMPDFTKPDEEEDDEEEEEEEGGNADEDFETAWDILDVARVIFEKGTDKETKLNLADVHLCLGDVSLETGMMWDTMNTWSIKLTWAQT